MKQFYRHTKNGFTLLEVLVVVTIIALLSVAVLTVLVNARMEARDNLRVNTIEQLKLAVRLYKEAHSEYPQYDDGTEIGVGNAIDTELEPFMKNIKTDPRGENTEYGYWYDSDFACTEEDQRVLLVQQLEYPDNSNAASLCGSGVDSELPSGWDSSSVFVEVMN